MDPEFLEARVEQRMRPGDADVGSQGQVHPGADGGTVDRRNRRKRAATDGHEPRINPFQTLSGCRAQRREVRTRAERLTGAGDDNRVHTWICLRAAHGFPELLRHRVGDRVAPVRVIDGDHGDSIDYLVQHQISHGFRG
jgi:hypothetical protein